MNASTLRAWRLQHDLTVREMAVLLGVGERTVKRWEAGQSRIPQRVAILLPRLQKSELNALRRQTERAAIRRRKGPTPRLPQIHS